jgi:hypothetical protein
MRFYNANGLFASIGTTFTILNGQTIPHQEDLCLGQGGWYGSRVC